MLLGNFVIKKHVPRWGKGGGKGRLRIACSNKREEVLKSPLYQMQLPTNGLSLDNFKLAYFVDT